MSDPKVHDPSPAGGETDGGPRKDDRVTLNKEFGSFDAFLSEYVSNVSRSGAFIRARQPLPVGTRVNLVFSVLMDGVEVVEGVGEVVRVHDDPAGMGVVFTELSNTSQAIIERLLTARRGRGAEEG
jgi:uncharacterized protein (TIGR02266 family)